MSNISEIDTFSGKTILAKVSSAYDFNPVLSEDEIRLDFQQWQAKRSLESPQFQFWSKTPNLELLILVFVQSVREGNFKLYAQSLNQLVPWFVALNPETTLVGYLSICVI